MTTPLPPVGSGWHPAAYCPNCHAPYRQELLACPECAPTDARWAAYLAAREAQEQAYAEQKRLFAEERRSVRPLGSGKESGAGPVTAFKDQDSAIHDAQTAYCLHCANEYPAYLNACPDCGWPAVCVPIVTGFLNAALHDGGRGVLVVLRAGKVCTGPVTWGQRGRG